MRERAATLVARIAADVPGLTVHDLSHLDALWETASLIAGDDYKLTAAEGYVLGGAILLHDAAMTLVAFPDGIEGLKMQDAWKDIVAAILAQRAEVPVTIGLIDDPPCDVVEEALPKMLRALHAQQAERLPTLKWDRPDGSAEFLIQNSDLRCHYGALIGKIAASHWWNVSEIENLPPICAAGPRLPSSWTVGPTKVACLLRVADASHIDHRRAPRWLRLLDNPRDASALHWEFQARIGKPLADGDALVLASGEPFPVTESDSWWLCFDTIQMIDRELRDVHQFLEDSSLPVFKLNHVKAADSPSRLSRYVRVEGWKPVDTRLRISDVPSLIGRFGGARLYGHDLRVPLRELIQNAADAIRGRRCEPDRSPNFGLIKVVLKEKSGEIWLEVHDDGIGMSPRTLSETLLDFGGSLWQSEAMRYENPGLLGRGLQVTGRFGIGFFSIFMLGQRVKVTSRHYRAGPGDTRTLEFRGGLSSRPVLRDPESDERLLDPGTRVSVLLDKPDIKDGVASPFFSKDGKARAVAELSAMVSALCPALDVQVDVIDPAGERLTSIHCSDWETLPGDRLLQRMSFRDPSSQERPRTRRAEYLRLLKDSAGRIYGRACIHGSSYGWGTHTTGVVTVGGFRASALNRIAGLLFSDKPETISRATAIPSASLESLREWATEQASLLADSDDFPQSLVLDAEVVLSLGGDVRGLPIVLKGEEGVACDDLREFLRDNDSIRVFPRWEVEYDEDKETMHRSHFEDFRADEDLIFASAEPCSLMAAADVPWPQCLPGYAELPGERTAFDQLRALVYEVWGDDCYEEEQEDTVGWVSNFYEIHRPVTVFTRLGASCTVNPPFHNLVVRVKAIDAINRPAEKRRAAKPLAKSANRASGVMARRP